MCACASVCVQFLILGDWIGLRGNMLLSGALQGSEGMKVGGGGSLSEKEKFTQTHIHMFRTNIHELNRNLNRQ